VTRTIMSLKNRLHFVEKITADNQRMRSLKTVSIPIEKTGIKRIFQELMDIAFLKSFARFIQNRLSQFNQRIVACRIKLIHPFKNRGIGRIDLNRMLQFIVDVTERRTARIDTNKLQHTIEIDPAN